MGPRCVMCAVFHSSAVLSWGFVFVVGRYCASISVKFCQSFRSSKRGAFCRLATVHRWVHLVGWISRRPT